MEKERGTSFSLSIILEASVRNDAIGLIKNVITDKRCRFSPLVFLDKSFSFRYFLNSWFLIG